VRLQTLASLLLVIVYASVGLLASAGVPGRLYLALGDSITFGFIANAGFAYVNPDNFIGFPNDIGQGFGMDVVNASCPGETAASFLSSTAPDNGCRFYRSLVPLHVAYGSTQAEFATGFLNAHPDVKLVTVGLGANDVLLLQARCANDGSCIQNGLPEVLATVRANLETILSDLRAAGFKGTLVVMNYYSLDDTDPNATAAFQALNGAIAAAAAQQHLPVADVFTAFQNAAAPAGGHACRAGLLNALPQNEFLCDIHPSLSGHALIARTIEQTVVTTRAKVQ
jgi:lysophospholipase L1-like esterase